MKTIGLFFGGMSNEAEVSVASAKNIAHHIDTNAYRLILIFWSKDGGFYQVPTFEACKSVHETSRIPIENFSKTFDIALPMTHGRYGEDGILQSIFESQKIAYCGCRVLGSALCMDKAMFKMHLLGHGIKQAEFTIIDYAFFDKERIDALKEDVRKNYTLPVFVKPSSSGSSVGVSRVSDFSMLDEALETAKAHDDKVLIEEGFVGYREIEVAILGNESLTVSRPGELMPSKDFYDYEDKYELGKAVMRIPAPMSESQEREIVEIAAKVYTSCSCRGFARVDFFVKDRIVLNEINTLPGFTNISMYPKLMQSQGIDYTDLISRIIELAY